MEENNFNKNYLIEITNKLYRLTLLFPKKEPLRYKMRELADEVLANFVSLPQEDRESFKITIIKSSDRALEIIDGFFDVAKSQNWVNPVDMLNLQREYSRIRQELIKLRKEEKVQKEEVEKESVELSVLEKEEEKPISERQKRILKVLRDKGKMQVGEVKNIFSEVSKRTLRRDFRSLLKYGLVEKMGEKNNTFYQAKDRTESVGVGQI